MGQTRSGTGLPSTSNADFDHPLDMLGECHERIEERCALLHRLAAHLAANGCDEQARQAAANVVRYFDTAGEHHHEDEEKDLFPRLVGAVPEAGALVHTLKREHGEMRTAWQALRVPLAAIAAGGGAALDAAQVERFTTLYRAHIAREEAELLPLAARVLDADTLREIGAAMAQRRGVRQDG